MKKFELTIPKPCHENWDKMSQEDKGRFCGSCQKTVIDFTDFSDRQIAEFFKVPTGNVCGRFGDEQLDRVIEVPRKRIPWVKYFFTIALPAFLLSKKAATQGEVRVKNKIAICEKAALKGDTIITPLNNPQPPNIRNTPIRLGMVRHTPAEQSQLDTMTTITGRVIDENGNPLGGASIYHRKTKQGTTTDVSGFFLLNVKQNEGVVEASYVGFTVKNISYRGQSNFSIVLQENKVELMGAIVIVPSPKKKPIPLIPIKQTDTAFSKFSIFPNPVSSNSSFTIQTKKLEDGRYNMSIITSAGEVVQTKELTIQKENKTVTIQLENVAAAPYFIRLTNKATNKPHIEIILVK